MYNRIMKENMNCQYPSCLNNGTYSKVQYAVRIGKLIKPFLCESCNKQSKRIAGHHESYKKPLEVVWLCQSCHNEVHRIHENSRWFKNRTTHSPLKKSIMKRIASDMWD